MAVTVNDEKYKVLYMTTHRTSILVLTLCNQPEAFVLDLGDDQSRYLYKSQILFFSIILCGMKCCLIVS